jgi:D-arabinose 1-dehydrogenase-like Zn-dependent alcohol dehydrogenase
MSQSKILGYAVEAVGQALKPFEYDPPDLGENDVRVAVTHCGLCHTDIHAIDNFYGLTEYPFVPGHEIVGKISQVGDKVSDLKIGERVGIGWQGRSCGKCEWCLRGEEQMCMDPTDLVAHDLSITGSFLGNRATMREMLAFAHVNAITPMVELMPMSQVNEAIQRVRENKVRYRIVLVN